MIKVPLPDVLEKIKKEGGLSDEELEGRIKKKIEQLSGLISREGAAHIICNELGIKLFDQISGKLKIGSILTGMRDVEVVGRAQQVFEVKEFKTESRSGKVGSLILADDSGTIRLVLWGSQADKLPGITAGAALKIKSGYAKENNGRKELHLGDRGELTLNPEGEDIPVLKQKAQSRKDIKALQDGEENVELLGTIVQIYDLRFFSVCPQCGKKALTSPEGTVCTTHGSVGEAFSSVLNLIIDDGSSTIQAVFFSNQVEHLLGKTASQLQDYRISPSTFDSVKHDLLGRQLKVVGKTRKNAMFDRLEFMVGKVFPNPDPAEELARIEAEAIKA